MPNPFKNFKLHFDRSFSKGFWSQLIWLVAIMLFVYVVLASISYLGGLYLSGGERSSRFIDILMVLIDPGSGSESMSSPFVIICAILGLVIFSGMLISVMSNVLERRVESYANGETDYKLSDHVVILGFNKSVPSLLVTINKKFPDSYVILMSCNDSELIRDWIHANVSEVIENHLVVMNGVRNTDDDLRRLNLKRNVREIYVIGEENEDAHDTINMQCVEKLNKLLPVGDVGCHVQIDSNSMYSVLQTIDFNDVLCQKTNDGSIERHLRFYPFNFNDIWTQKVIATVPNAKYKSLDGSIIIYKSLDGHGITHESKKHVHLIIVGMNDMATTLAINSAHVLHFPNYIEGDMSTCSKITFIDENAEKLGEYFRGCYKYLFSLSSWKSVDAVNCRNENSNWIDPMDTLESDFQKKHLGPKNFMDIRWEFIKGSPYDKNVQEYLTTSSLDENRITTVALCHDESEKNIGCLMALPESIVKNANQILVRQTESPVTVELIGKLPWHENVKPFGMMNECYDENLMSDKYGKLINACYGDYSSGQKKNVDINDSIKVDELWESCRILDKWSSIYSANMLFYKMRSMGLDTDKDLSKDDILQAVEHNKTYLAELEHNRWDTEKLLLGFRYLFDESEFVRWTENKKEENGVKSQKNMKLEKVHHDIRAFSMLSKADKDKDDDVNSRLYELYKIIKSK